MNFLHFSPRSGDQLKAHVLIEHHLLLSPAPALVLNAPPTKSSRSPRAAACNMESSLGHQLARLAAFQELITLGEHKTPAYHAGAHTRYESGRPGATMCKTSKIRRRMRCLEINSA